MQLNVINIWLLELIFSIMHCNYHELTCKFSLEFHYDMPYVFIFS